MFLDPAKLVALQDIQERVDFSTSILEVGFGSGEVLRKLSKLGYEELAGAELSYRARRLLWKRLGPKARVFSEVPVELAVECVLCFEVLEHQDDPQEFLTSLPGRFLYLSVPNVERWWVRLTGRFEPWDYPPNHLHRFDTFSLLHVLSSAGYTRSRVLLPKISWSEILEPLVSLVTFKLGLRRNSVSSGSGSRSKLPRTIGPLLYSVLKLLSSPVALLVSHELNRRGYRGRSLLVVGERA